MRRKLMTLSALLLATQALGGEVRNGGNAVVCYEDPARTRITSIELFDFWEGRQVYPNLPPVSLGKLEASVKDRVDAFIWRVYTYDRERASRYFRYSDILLPHLNDFMVDAIPGTSINDDTPLREPTPPCYREQFAVQVRDPLPGARRFQISRRLYEDPHTSNETRAGILIHEIVHRDAIERDHHTKSDGSRRAVYYFSTPRVEIADPVEVKEMYHAAGLAFAENAFPLAVHNFRTRLLVTAVPRTGQIIPAIVATPATLFAGRDEIRLEGGTRVTLEERNGAYFLRTIEPQSATLEETPEVWLRSIEIDGRYYDVGSPTENEWWSTHYNVPRARFEFTDFGRLIRLPESYISYLDLNQAHGLPPLSIRTGGVNTKCEIFSSGTARPMELGEGGAILGCSTRGTLVTLPDGTTIRHAYDDYSAEFNEAPLSFDEIEDRDYLAFYPNGALKRATSQRAVQLPTLAGNRRYPFHGVFQLDPDGRVRIGTVVKTVRDGILELRYDALVFWNGKEYVAQRTNPNYQDQPPSRVTVRVPEMPILASESAVETYCRKLGGEAGAQIGRRTVDAIGTRNFYDLDLGKVVTRTDQPVKAWTDFRCQLGEIVIDMP